MTIFMGLLIIVIGIASLAESVWPYVVLAIFAFGGYLYLSDAYSKGTW